jgi:hypothetical protein
MLIIPILGTCAVLLCGQTGGDHRSFWPLTARPMQFVGRISYSIYLWHWPTLVLGTFLFPDIEMQGRLALVAVALALAGVSYYLIENPIRRCALRVLAERGLRVALIRDIPFMSIHVPTCLSRVSMRHGSAEACGRSRQLATDDVTFAGELAALRNVPGMSIIDMTDLFCDRELCPAVRNGTIVYRDTNHMTEDFVRSLQEELAVRLDAAAATSGNAAQASEPGARR